MPAATPNPPSECRANAAWVASQLQAAGHIAYFAGGCVRDLQLGLEPKDYDVATDARPEDVKRLFKRAHAVGEAFGVVLVRRKGTPVEVATFRCDGPYDDQRRPSSVHFASPYEDAQRRHFTINGMFEDPKTGKIIDHVEGIPDLAARRIRAIGDPDARIAEDRLRMLRAVRFAARFNFEIESATADAIRRHATELGGVSRERIGHELRMILTGPRPVAGIGMIEALGLDGAMLMAPPRGSGPLDRVGAIGAGSLVDADLPLPSSTPVSPGLAALAAWAIDRGETDPAIADRWAEALVLSGRERSDLTAILRLHRDLVNEFRDASVARRKRLAGDGARFAAALAILAADDAPAAADIARDVRYLAETAIAPDPMLDGDRLVAAGYAPGPRFGDVLRQVYDAQLEGRVDDPESALGLARTLLDGNLGGDDGELPESSNVG